MYAPLWVKSNYSFLEGASHPEELVAQAAAFGLPAIAITDRDGVYGIVKAHEAAREHGIRPIIGAQVTSADCPELVLLAQNRAGYAKLCRTFSAGHLRGAKGECRLRLDEICANSAGLTALWTAAEFAIPGALKDAFGERIYAMVTRHKRACEVRKEARMRAMAKELDIPVVAGNEVLYHRAERRDLQDVLTCVRHGVALSKAGRLLRENDQYFLRSSQDFAGLFADDPEVVTRTLEIAEGCRFSLGELRYVYPTERLPGGRTTQSWLRELTLEGAAQRYPEGVPDRVQMQIEKELALIEELEYSGYFLTMWEIVCYCREHNILCQGRGSAANSAVCFCLGITAIDPVRMELLFERFLSRERAEPPDIDLDIEHERREEVIQHVYQRYGRRYAAMVAIVVCYRQRSAIREVGKALGMADDAVELAARAADSAAKDADPREMWRGEAAKSAAGHFGRLCDEIYGFPRHLSIHPGGFLLGHDPVDELVPIENGAMADRTVIQWDKDDIDALGLFKVDLLGLGALALLHRCFDLIHLHGGPELSMASIPHGDGATYAMLERADAVGLFQLESRAQMAMLPRTKPRMYYDLVVQISIIRPGPIVGGMVHPYLRRRAGEEAIDYPHPALEPVLRKTLGIPLFQEQVMKVAMVAADYTPGEADQLRRDMAAWRKAGRLERHRERLIERMMAKGITQEFAERVFQQISGFGEYGFPESHAASFALIAYATAWLKCHHRVAFTAALLNSQPMGFYSVATIIDDAKRAGVVVLAVDVSASHWDCVLEALAEGCLAIRVGLRFVKGLSRAQGLRIPQMRSAQPFSSQEDVVRRCGLDRKARAVLAEAGAFASFGSGRRQALWEALESPEPDALPLAFAESAPEFAPLDDFERVGWDYSASGHSSFAHPLAPMRERLRQRGLPTAEEVRGMPDGEPVSYAGLVICRQRPGTASGVLFVTLEDETGFVNLILWPKVFEKYELLARTAGFLGVSGVVQSESGVVHVIVRRLWLPQFSAPSGGPSRDFH
jgi:error-prone DNA polymerase